MREALSGKVTANYSWLQFSECEMGGYTLSWQSGTWCTESLRTPLCEPFSEKEASLASRREAAHHLGGCDTEEAALVGKDERAPAACKSF